MTNYLNYGKENVLTVRVDASQYEGWYYEGAGIYRHVWLQQYNNIHIAEDGLFVHSTASTVTIETTITNDGPNTATATASAFLTTRNGKLVGRAPAQLLNLKPNEHRTIIQQIPVAHPNLWS